MIQESERARLYKMLRLADLRLRSAMSREPCVLIWSEVIRLTKAEPKRKSAHNLVVFLS